MTNTDDHRDSQYLKAAAEFGASLARHWCAPMPVVLAVVADW